jgi:hypothetical protein
MANTFKRKISRAVGTSNTSIGSYTVPAATQVTVIGLTVANIANSIVTTSVLHHDGTNSTYIIKDANIPVGGTIVVVGGDQKLVLETGDSVRASSNSAAALDCIMSVLEIT